MSDVPAHCSNVHKPRLHHGGYVKACKQGTSSPLLSSQLRYKTGVRAMEQLCAQFSTQAHLDDLYAHHDNCVGHVCQCCRPSLASEKQCPHATCFWQQANMHLVCLVPLAIFHTALISRHQWRGDVYQSWSGHPSTELALQIAACAAPTAPTTRSALCIAGSTPQAADSAADGSDGCCCLLFGLLQCNEYLVVQRAPAVSYCEDE